MLHVIAVGESLSVDLHFDSPFCFKVRGKMNYCGLDETEFTASEPHSIAPLHKQSLTIMVQISCRFLRSFAPKTDRDTWVTTFTNQTRCRLFSNLYISCINGENLVTFPCRAKIAKWQSARSVSQMK